MTENLGANASHSPVEHWHGTMNGYTNHFCRCAACKAAIIEYRRERYTFPCLGCGTSVWRVNTECRACRTARLSVVRPEQHGTQTGYKKGCRCRSCKDASARGRRARRLSTRHRETVATP